jgi:transcriptional regulator with GAF, ATPase, and Fis domain
VSNGREIDIAQTFVSLASSLANGNDVVDLLAELTADCARLLDVASAGLLLADRRGVLHVMAGSSEATRNLELFQLQRDQGPCLDCYRTGRAVIVEDLIADAAKWPQFAQAAIDAGFRSVHALPMRLRNNVLGALNLFGTAVGALSEGHLQLGQALADVASVALVQATAAADEETLNRQLQGALDSRIVVEQAKGILSERAGLDMEEAFKQIRRFSRDHNRQLSEVAKALVNRTLTAEQLVGHVQQREGQPRVP